MNTKYLTDFLIAKYANATSYGWAVNVTLVALLIAYASVYTGFLDWFWEIIIGGISL